MSAYSPLIESLSLVAVLLVFGIEAVWCYLAANERLYAIPLALLLIHAMIYYIVAIVAVRGDIVITAPQETFASWSTVLQLQSLLTWALLEGARLHRRLLRRRAIGRIH